MKKKPAKKNNLLKNIFLAIGLTVVGIIFLNLIFLFAAMFHWLSYLLLNLFVLKDTPIVWFPAIIRILFLVVVCGISWFVFRSKLPSFWKAAYMVIPIATAFVTIGIFFSNLSIVVYLLCGLIALCILNFIYRAELPWIYYFSFAITCVVMLLVQILQIEI